MYNLMGVDQVAALAILEAADTQGKIPDKTENGGGEGNIRENS